MIAQVTMRQAFGPIMFSPKSHLSLSYPRIDLICRDG
jgi:hypothetical protein